MKSVFKAIVLSFAMISMATAPALAEGDKKVDGSRMKNIANGKRCTFTKNEKIMMVTWIFPVVGAVWTGVACKKETF